MSATIVWLRQDLRLTDNPALYYAAARGNPVIPIYIFNPDDTWAPGGAQRWWLHHSLMALQLQLAKQKIQLVLQRGCPQSILLKLLKATQADSIYWNRCYEPTALKRDKNIEIVLGQLGLEIKTFNSALLFEPWEIYNSQGKCFRIFTPFWKTCLRRLTLKSILAKPKLKGFNKVLPSDDINSWQLVPHQLNWAKAFASIWQPGELGAQKNLTSFLQKILPHYAHDRDHPAIQATSQLSPHLHFGEIGPRQICHALKNLPNQNKLKTNINKFLSELGWREFCYYILYHFPELPNKALRREFNKLPWQKNAKYLHAWQQGKTGYPIVDAGMRQLWQIGWLHNRLRMIVASFLIKDLFIAWQTGEAWFWDTLVDADLANNAAGWQWVAGSGTDAMPYFRIFNPILQSKKFDPDGEYIKHWLPELKDLSKKFIHQPWLAPKEILTAANIKLDQDYPGPIINHDETKKKFLKLFKKFIKNKKTN